MYERRGLEGMATAFFPEIAGCELAQLAIDQWCELRKSLLVALSPLSEEPRHIVRGGHTRRP